MKKKTKIILISSILLIIVLVSIVGIIIFNKLKNKNISSNENLENLEEYISDDEIMEINLNNIEGKYSDIVINDFITAKQSINEVKDKIGISSVESELQDDKTNKISQYKDTYTFKQLYNGVEVYDGELIVYTDKNGTAKGIINSYKDLEGVNTTPKNNATDLETVIRKECGENINIKNSKTVLYPVNENEYKLAYEYSVELFEGELGNITEKIIVSDDTGEIITKISPIYYYTNDELNSFLEDNKYTLQDNVRNIIINNPSSNKVHFGKATFSLYSWNQGEETDEDRKNAVDYITTLQKCYDYYSNKFNYYSITGDGKFSDGSPAVLNMITNVKEYKYDNNEDKKFGNNAAFVAPSIFLLGDNDLYATNVEVLGHEYTHGVMLYKTGIDLLAGNKEQKAVAEAYSDIMGMCIEAYYKDYDRIDGYISSNNGRDIKNSELRYSKKYLEKHEEHENSIMLSKVAYMMSSYLTTEELEKVWFESIDYLGRNPSFAYCYYGVVMASRDIGLSEEKQQAIINTFNDLGFGIIEIDEDYQTENKNNEESTNEAQENAITENTTETNSVEEQNKTNNNEVEENTTNVNKNSNNNQTNSGTEQLSVQETVNLLNKEFGNYKDVKVNYEYQFSVTYQNKKYYAIYALAEKNYMYNGGEWLPEMDDGRFYAGTYYVAANYTNNKVHVGLNNRDLDKYKEGDNVGYFLQSYYLDVN